MIVQHNPLPTPTLFDPIRLGPYVLPHRVFMAPLTRGRADPDGTPTDIMAVYYAQRASAGLIISEATAISPQGVGWHNAPGIFTPRHVEAWKPITDAVHRAGGHIFLQLWHTGRVSHPDFVAGGRPVGPSAVAAAGQARTPAGRKPFVVPRALTGDELPGVAEDYARAARRAIQAGFDGAEIHAANGYLLDQFIRDASNRRRDDFGGSIARRWRFPIQATQAVIDEIGASRTGVRVSPSVSFNSMGDSDPVATFTYGARELGRRGIAYLHVVEGPPGHPFGSEGTSVHPHIRAAFDHVLILNGGFDAATGHEPWRAARPMPSPTASPSSRTRICRRASAPARCSTCRIRRPSTRPARGGTQTIRSCTRGRRSRPATRSRRRIRSYRHSKG